MGKLGRSVQGQNKRQRVHKVHRGKETIVCTGTRQPGCNKEKPWEEYFPSHLKQVNLRCKDCCNKVFSAKETHSTAKRPVTAVGRRVIRAVTSSTIDSQIAKLQAEKTRLDHQIDALNDLKKTL